jgi:hypothetical protein
MENEINGKYVVITSKFNCQSYPLNERAIYVSDEDLEQIGKTKCFDVESNCVIDYDNTIDKIIERKNELRTMRVPLLKAFDVYKSSVAYGVEFENEEQREEIVKWYSDLLHLEESAFEVIPERIRYYL